MSFCTAYIFVTVRLRLGLGFGFGIGNLNHYSIGGAGVAVVRSNVWSTNTLPVPMWPACVLRSLRAVSEPDARRSQCSHAF